MPTTSGAMMELRCVTAVLRHGDRTPKQKMKMDIRHPKFFEIFAKYGGYSKGSHADDYSYIDEDGVNMGVVIAVDEKHFFEKFSKCRARMAW